MSPLLSRIAPLLLVTATVAVNALANIQRWGGANTGEIANSVPQLFLPAGWVFSIWSLIYLALGAWSIRHLIAPRSGLAGAPSLARLPLWFALGSLGNMAWIACWHQRWFLASMGAMLLLLASLLATAIGIDRAVKERKESEGLRWSERLLLVFPFRLYLGWISVATIANFATMFASWGWTGTPFPGAFWNLVVILVALVLAGWRATRNDDFVFGSVVVWALAGIAARFPSRPDLFLPAAGSAASLVFFLSSALWFKKRMAEERRRAESADEG